jgi:hypothetical protein
MLEINKSQPANLFSSPILSQQHCEHNVLDVETDSKMSPRSGSDLGSVVETIAPVIQIIFRGLGC